MSINKKIFLLLITLIIIFPLLPVHAASDWGEAMGSDAPGGLSIFAKDVFDGLISGLAWFVAVTIRTVSLYILDLSSGLLSWVTSPDFISMGAADITKGSPTYNFVVDMGWGIVRNLANAALVIGLIFIAINIILGNDEGKTKRNLISFILIALLINFTPVICGFIIDGSNIIMHSFLTGGGVNPGYADEIYNAFDTARNLSENKEPINLLVANLAVCLFAIVASVIYFLYAFIFAIRHIFLWILVIVSPIAFATYVFPKSEYITKVFPSITHWNEWLSQFIQWCVIGIPAGFFMYLSNQLMVYIANNGGAMVSTSSASGVSAVLQGILPYLIPLGILLIGFFMTISAGQQAASGTVGGGALGSMVGGAIGGLATGAMGAGRAVAGTAWDKTAGWAGDRAGALGTWAKEGITGRIGGAISNLAGNEKIDTGTKEGREAGRYKFREYIGKPRELATKYRLASPTMIGRKSKDEIAADEFAKNVDFDDYEKYKERYSQPQKTAIEKKLATDDLSKFLRGAGDNPAEYQRRLRSVSEIGSNKASDKAKFTAYLKTVGNDKAGTSDWAKILKVDVPKQVSSMSAKDARENLTAGALGNFDILKHLDGKQISSVMDWGSAEQRDALKDWSAGGSKNPMLTKHVDDLTKKLDDLDQTRSTDLDLVKRSEAQKEYDQVQKEYQKLATTVAALNAKSFQPKP